MNWQPISDTALPQRLAEAVAARPGVVRVAIDGAPSTAPDTLAQSLVQPLRDRGRPVHIIPAAGFWHDASLRFEHGRRDVRSYLGWLDHRALQREVLAPAPASQTYLPSLRDPVTNRSARAVPQHIGADAVLIVSGSLLLGLGLSFDVVVHLHAPADRLARDTAPADAWTLPAYADYDATVAPAEIADVVIRVGRRTPAVTGL